MTVRVLTTARADQDIHLAAAWWRENRQASPFLFEDELDKAIDLLAEHPDAGHVTRIDGIEFRALHLQRSRYRVYYEHDPVAQAVVIRAVWGAVRGRPPRLHK